MPSIRTQGWLGAVVAVFVIQSHCGLPAVHHDRLALRFLERGHHDRALLEARRAARETPEDPQPHVIAALAHAALGTPERAVAALEHALRLDPDDPRLYGTLRSLSAETDREELALEVLQRMQAETPDHWLLRLNLGWAYRAVGDDEEALRLLEAAVAHADSSAPEAERVLAHHELARIYLGDGRADEAAIVLEKALELSPTEPALLVAAGECRLQNGQALEAEDHFLRALDATQDLQATASSIAQIYYGAGDKGLAIDYYERAIRQHRPSPLVLNNLAWTYAEEDLRLERALELSLQALKSDAQNVVYLDTYAEILFRRGRTAQAVAMMRRCLQLEPEDGEHYEYLQGQMVRFTAAGDSLL